MQPPTQFVPDTLSPGLQWPRCEIEHSLSSGGKIKNAWSHTSTPTCYRNKKEEKYEVKSYKKEPKKNTESAYWWVNV
jgi:hypothetical protein